MVIIIIITVVIKGNPFLIILPKLFDPTTQQSPLIVGDSVHKQYYIISL